MGVIQCRKIDTVELYHHQVVRRIFQPSELYMLLCVCGMVGFSLWLSRCMYTILYMLFISLPMFSLYSLACYFLSFFLSFHFWFSHLSFGPFSSIVSSRFSLGRFILCFLRIHIFFVFSIRLYIYLCLHIFLLLFILVVLCRYFWRFICCLNSMKLTLFSWTDKIEESALTHSFTYTLGALSFTHTHTNPTAVRFLSLSLSTVVLYFIHIYIIHLLLYI